MPQKDKEARKLYLKEYYQRNKEHIKAKSKSWSESPDGKVKRQVFLEKYNKKNKAKIIAGQAKCYQNNKDKYKERIQLRLKEHSELVAKVKQHYGCMSDDCKWSGGYDGAILDLHHIDPSEKELRVSSMLCRTKSVIAKEINKCLVLCSNCHRLLHIKQIVSVTRRCSVSDELMVLE